MERELYGGVLMIGSLFWQNHFDNKKEDNKRLDWRFQNLNLDSIKNVKIPIRYGRFSKDGAYTMILDHNLPAEKYGTGKLISIKKKIENLKVLNNLVHGLSVIEGGEKSNKFIRGKKKVWCVCGFMLNPKIEENISDEFKSNWSAKLQENKEGYKSFLNETALFSMVEYGELQIPWPKDTDLDFIIATSTRPQLRDDVKSISTEEITRHINNRPYFYPNYYHGIQSYLDEGIIKSHSTSDIYTLEQAKSLLLASPRIKFSKDKKWSKRFLSHPGVYILFNKGEINYIGETGNIRKRMGDLRKTLNHSYRRALGFELFSEKATSKNKFSEENEDKLDKYCIKNIEISFHPFFFGRKEIEEFMVNFYEGQILNLKKKRH